MRKQSRCAASNRTLSTLSNRWASFNLHHAGAGYRTSTVHHVGAPGALGTQSIAEIQALVARDRISGVAF